MEKENITCKECNKNFQRKQDSNIEYCFDCVVKAGETALDGYHAGSEFMMPKRVAKDQTVCEHCGETFFCDNDEERFCLDCKVEGGLFYLSEFTGVSATIEDKNIPEVETFTLQFQKYEIEILKKALIEYKSSSALGFGLSNAIYKNGNPLSKKKSIAQIEWIQRSIDRQINEENIKK